MRRSLVPLVVLLLAGCFEPSPPFSARDIPDTAPTEAGTGPRTVTVHVETEQGPAPARVAVWWVVETSMRDGKQVLRAEGLRLFGPAGTVVAHVPDDKDIHVAAATDSARTEEWRFDAFPVGSADVQTVRLYDVHRTIAVEDVWDERLLVSLAPYTDIHWYPVDPVFSADAAWDQGYEQRIVDVEGILRWTNDGLHMADLGVLVAPEGNKAEYCHIQDDDDDLALGQRSQEFVLPYRATCPPLPPIAYPIERPVRIGPAVDSHAVGVDGLPFAIDADVRLFRWNGWQEQEARFENTTLEVTWLGAGGPTTTAQRPVPTISATLTAGPAPASTTAQQEDLQGWTDPYGPGSFVMNVFAGAIVLVLVAVVLSARRR